jgi:hypothetical protein
MHFLIAANHRMKTVTERCIKSLEALNYRYTIFDLGGLGFGQAFTVEEATFHSNGYYDSTFNRWPTRALHKPKLISYFLENAGDPIVYLDADTFVRRHIDEIVGDYDIGVTIRSQDEAMQKLGRINAGVIFLNPTARARNFVRQWEAKTKLVGNDQHALNILADGSGCSLKEFPCEIYNWYYFPGVPPPQAKILHFKTGGKEMFGWSFNAS